jgi:hypothetical protein
MNAMAQEGRKGEGLSNNEKRPFSEINWLQKNRHRSLTRNYLSFPERNRCSAYSLWRAISNTPGFVITQVSLLKEWSKF